MAIIIMYQHLLDMQNYCTLTSVMNGLSHPSIKSLKKTFAKVNNSTLRHLKDMQKIVFPKDNFKLLRAQLRKATGPCIPHL